MEETTKPINPKDSIGSTKLPMHLWPMTATIMGSMGFLDGALKYGRGNYRATPVRASIYYDATMRHMSKWFSGQDIDTDSGLPHFAHALACLAILVDSQANGTLIDDRDFNSLGMIKLLEEMTTQVKAVQANHAGKTPKHYDIRDTK